jgi:hypothetical protein
MGIVLVCATRLIFREEPIKDQTNIFTMATAADEIKIPVKLFVSKFPASFTEEQLREVCEWFSLILLCLKDICSIW